MKLIYCRPEFLHVQHRHIYLHSRTCTHSGLCRWPSILVAFHICYLLDCASIHEISALVIMIPLFPVYIKYLHLLWRSWSIVYLQLLWRSWSIVYLHPLWIFLYIVYCTWQWPHMSHFCISCLSMAIVLLCIRDYYMYLQSYIEIYYCTIPMDGWFFHLVLHHSTCRMDFIIYFGHRVTPLISHIRGNIL